MTTMTNTTASAESRSRRRKALIAAVCGGALLLGGSTFALWTQSASLTAGNIQTGTFGVAVNQADVKAWDISADRADGGTSIGYSLDGTNDITGHEITGPNLMNFGMSPGDKVA
ncbi:MAG: SipW-dependent-type signal peptide-containing protein, partial [Bifidobacteriaceae bacterium]|nr:SipW-dependent-type signal peptide-containing protein [Bifidobacteriaceae bacterium]